jgi:hypothetical protein
VGRRGFKVWSEEWANGWMGGGVGFININDMYNNDVGQGVVYAFFSSPLTHLLVTTLCW